MDHSHSRSQGREGWENIYKPVAECACMNRREYITALGGGCTVALAGCESTSQPDQDSPTSTETRNDPSPTSPTDSVLDVPVGHTHDIPASSSEQYKRADIDGTLTVRGTLTLKDS